MAETAHPLVNLKVLLFASAREMAGMSEATLADVPSHTNQEQLMRRVVEEFSLTGMAGSLILAHNQNYVLPGDTLLVKEGDELAVIPPLSGG